jgi:hypothetical protein
MNDTPDTNTPAPPPPHRLMVKASAVAEIGQHAAKAAKAAGAQS